MAGAQEECGTPTEAELLRQCGTLYLSHGLEATCGLVMFCFFSVVAVQLHVRNHLRSPGLAFLRCCRHFAYQFLAEFVTTLCTLGQMHEMKLEVRLRFCRNLDKMVSAASAILSFLAITRWLSIGNVNGMRYVGYAFTCPLTQVQLVAMLAPVVPCYRLCAFISFLLTFVTLTSGYAASLLWMPLWEGDPYEFFQTWDLDDLKLTRKALFVSPAVAGMSLMWVFMLPYLVLIYTVRGGSRNEDLPRQYRLLVSLVWITWLLFPCWWLYAWEGGALVADPRLNEVGFTVLNIITKGLFSLQIVRMCQINEAMVMERRGCGGGSKRRRRHGGTTSPTTVSDEGGCVPDVVSRASSRRLNVSHFVKVLRTYDEDRSLDSEGNRMRVIRAYGCGEETCRTPPVPSKRRWPWRRGRDDVERDDEKRRKEHWKKFRNHY